MTQSRQLGVFGKFWEPGKVKTRLGETVGYETAASMYRALLETTLRRFAGTSDFHVLAFTPPNRQDEFSALAGSAWRLVAQSDGDLGDRIKNYFQRAFSEGFQQVVLIGSDSPSMPAERIDEAFAALRDHCVVLGPTGDGGYYLIGAARYVPEIFEQIDWSTPQVLQQTTGKLASTGTSFATLPPWYDIDDHTDLQRLQCELADDALQDAFLLQLRHDIERELNWTCRDRR